MIKFIYPNKIKFDTYKLDINKTLIISFHNFEDLQETQFITKEISLLFINNDCSSKLIRCESIYLSDVLLNRLELKYHFRTFTITKDPKEAIPWIREMKIKKILG